MNYFLIDSNYLSTRLVFSINSVPYEQKSTYIIFSFLNSLLSLSKLFPEHKFIFAWDSKKSLRREIYPEYKQGRNLWKDFSEEDKILCTDQFFLLKNQILKKIGFNNIYKVEGYESDDIIAYLSKKLEGKVVIVSSDGDLYQLLDGHRVVMYDLNKKKIFHETKFRKEYGLGPSYWSLVKSVSGCDSDKVKGVQGIGEKTAIKYFLNNLTGKKLEKIKNSGDIIKRNLKLVFLPYEGFPDLQPLKEDFFKLTEFEGMCLDYGFSFFLRKDNFEQWKRIFK